MISCGGCQKKTIFYGSRFQTCPSCDKRVHVIEEHSYLIPALDLNENRELTFWHGYGENLLHELNRNPPRGFLQTRINVVLQMTNMEYKTKRLRESLWININRKLALYGLKVTLFDENLNIQGMDKSEFLSTPCFIQLLNYKHPEIAMPHKILQQSEKVSQPDETISSDWIKSQLKKMYPGQTLSIEQNDAIGFSVETPGSLTSIVIPTGSGKTRIPQSLAISLRNGHGTQLEPEGPILVLYPTISLMDDQKKEWKEKLNLALSRAGLDELNVRVLHSNEEEEERNAVGADLLDGKIDILLCSPEQLVPSKKKISIIEIAMRLNGNCKGKPFSALIIDEVHIAFDWGDSIREAFLLLPQMENMLRRINPQLRTILMTATLTPREEDELIRNMGTKQSGRDKYIRRIRKAEVRPDLAFTIIDDGNRELTEIAGEEYTEYTNNHRWRLPPYNSKSPLLIYTFKPSDCEEIASHLQGRIGSSRIETYHGNTKGDQRKKKLDRFQRNDISLMVATSAFGMGVNKSDVWMISYIGMPGTLRELYQSFGRAARGSGWNKSNSSKKNGNCIARIVRRPMRGYAPTFSPSKALERLIPMILMGEITSNGYALLSLNPEHQIYWNPYDESDSRKKDKKAEQIERERLLENSIMEKQVPAELDAWWIKRWQNRIKNRMNREYNKRRKATIYLEMAGVLKIHGFFPANPFVSDKNGSLKELLESGGIEEVIHAYSDIGWDNSTQYNTQSKDHFMVAELHQGIENISDLIIALENGIKRAETWANTNQNELKNFLENKNECVRIRFLPVVGGDIDNASSCEELFQQQQHHALDYGISPVMPCSVCRSKMWPYTDPLYASNSNIKFTGKKPHSVWLEGDGLEYLSGRLSINSETLDDDVGGSIEQLPFENFICGFTFSETESRPNLHSTHIQNKWYELCQRQGISSNNIQLKINTIIDCDGYEYPNNEQYFIGIQLMAQQAVSAVDCSMLPTDQYPFGGLIYLIDEKIVCRLIKSDRMAIAAYDSIKKKWYDHNDLIEDRFIGGYRPDIHGGQTKRGWNK